MNHSDDRTIRALTGAVKDIRVPTRAAWVRVRAAMQNTTAPAARRPSLRPAMASLTLVTAFFTFSQFGLINALAHPTVTAGVVPAPQVNVGTPVAGLIMSSATATPQPTGDAAPVPLPPGHQ